MDNDYIDVLRNEARMRQQTSPGVDSVDPMVQFAEEERARQRQLYKGTTIPALSTNPDVYAKQKQDAALLNVPTAVVQTLPQDSARQVQLKALDDNTAQAPVLRQKYTDSDFAKLAHDDSQSLSTIEKSLNYIFSKGDRGLVYDVLATPYKLSEGFAGAWRAGSENLADLIDTNSNAGLSLLPESMASKIKKVNDANSPMRDSLRAFADYWKNESELAKAKANQISGEDTSIVGGGIQSGVSSFVQNMLVVPTAFIPIVGPYASLSLLATSQGGTAYNEARKEGLDPQASLAYGLRQGGLEAAFEIAPILKLVKDVKIGASLSRLFLNNIALELPGEVSTTLLQNLDTYATLHPDRSFESFLREQPAAVAQTVIATIIGSGGNVAVGKIMESVVTDLQSHEQKIQQSTRTKQFIETITAATEESKLRARDLETFQSFVSATTDGTPAQDVYISAQTLLQSGVAEQVAKVLPSVAEQLNDAAQSNGFIRIPTAEYVANISGTDLNQKLIDNIQLDPNGYTFKESEQYAKTFNQEMNAQLEKILIETKNDEVFNESKGKVRDQFLNELNATGRFTTETNAAYADLLASFYAVQAAKLGINTEELVQRYQLKTQAESVTGPALDQNGSRASSGGQIATANGYFYKGGQFLPSTETPPGKFKVGKKWVAAKSFLIEPGKNETQPTATALSIFSGIREYTTLDDNGNLILKEGIRDGQGGEVNSDAPYLEREGYPVMTYGDVVNAYNNGQRWVDVQAQEPVVNDNILNQSGTNDSKVDNLQMVAERGQRATGTRANISPEERTSIEASAIAIGMTVAQLTQVVRSHKLAHPTSQGWAPLIYLRSQIKDGKVLHEYKNTPYDFSAGADGNALVPGTANYTRRVNAIARGMLEEVRNIFVRAQAGDKNAQNILAQAGWYKAMRSRLRQEFGGLGDLFADLLGATSPNTPVRDNWYNAVDAMRRAMRGDFDELMPQWEQWASNLDDLEIDLRAWFNDRMAEGLSKKAIKELPEYQQKLQAVRSAREIPDALLPTKESGAKYGFNGKNVIRAMVDLWRVVKNADPDIARGGTAPKALNFSGNLIGFRERATIDVWAARMLQRLSGGRRIPSMAETGVSGEIREDATTTLQFGFGQDVFTAAATAIRDDAQLATNDTLANINDDDLQAVVWFVEKEVWTINNWTNAAGEGGSFELEASLTGTSQQARVKELRSIIDASPPSKDVATAGEDTAKAVKAIEAHEQMHAAEIDELRRLESGEIEPYKGSKKRIAELQKIARPPAEATRLLANVERANQRLQDVAARKVAARSELAALEREVDRFVGGLSTQMSADTQGVDFVPTDADMARLTNEIRIAIYEADEGNMVLASKALSTEGRYGGVERSLDLEVVTREGYNANTLWAEMLRQAQAAQQDSTFLSRVLRANEEYDPLRHRPGVEIYFREAAAQEKLEQMLAELAKEGVEFLTVIVDGRRMSEASAGGMPAAVGVRIQYVPEFEQRYGMSDFNGLSDEEISITMERKAAELQELAFRVAASVEGVSFADQFWYDTQVAFSHEYQEKLDGLTIESSEEISGSTRSVAELFAGQSVRSGIESANRQVRETTSRESGRDVLGGDAQSSQRQADELAAGARRANAGEEGSTGVSGQTQITTGTGSPGQTGVLNQSSELNQQARGAISFGDDITRVPSIIALLKNADLSTFLHESGHFFLQVQADLAARIEGMAKGLGASDAEMSIVNDMNIVLDWLGIKATPEQSAISVWMSMPLEEQRQYHETFARGFEAYAFEGNAPTLELQSVFQKFRSWLLNIYKELKNLNVELSDEVRGVFDRMLATTEQIKAAESARAMGPLFTPQNSAGLIADFKAYHDLGLAATQQAIDELQVRGLADMKWLGNARSKVLKELQATAKGLRNEAVMDARREIMSQPIYRAWQFLTAKISADDKLKATEPRKSMPGMVDPQIDSLFVAMAKLGGLRREEVSTQWGLDEKIPFPLFGKPVVRNEGGLSIDEMGSALAEDGYLTKDENGRYDLTEFEEKFHEEISGRTQYSSFVDPTIFTDELPGSNLNLEGLAAGRLSAAVVNSMGLDDAVVARLIDLKMIAKEGLAPDLVAELFGLTSGDELVRTIAASPKPADAISLLADKYMLERHGELATPEAIQRAADAAIHNDMRLKALYTEAKALETALNVREDTGRTNAKGHKITSPLIPKAAREFAARLIARTRIRDLKPSQYTAAEVRAAKAAQDAFIKNDVAKAAEEKRNQIINATAAKEAMAAQVEVLKAVAYFKRFDKRSKTLDPDYYDQIAQMLERFSFVPSASLKSIDKQTSLATWIESQREAGFEPNIPPSLENELYRQNYKNMTVEEIRGLRDTIEQIEHLGRLKNKLLTAQDAREFAAIRDDIVASINEFAGDRQANNRTSNTLTGQALDSVKKFWAAHIKAATWARIMDGGFDGGYLWKYIIRPANVAGDQEIQMRKEATHALTELIKPVLAEGKMGGKGQFFPSIDRSLNKEARLAIALNMGNEGNQQRLLDGEKWTLSQIKPVLDTLTAADWQFVQSVWDYFESYRPLIAAKEKRVMGKEPVWIEVRALQVQTSDGQDLNLRGGYYPIKYDPMASERAETQLEAEEAKKQLQSAYTSATTRRSFTKTRADVVKNRPLLYSLDGIYQGVNEVIHDLAWHEWLIDTNRLIKNPKIAETMREKYGAEVHQQFKSWLKDTAEGDRGAANSAEKSLGWIRQGVSVSGLGFNVMSALTQPFGITQSVVRVGAPWIARGLQKFMAHPIETAGEITAMSSFMENRFLTRMRELAELRSVVKGQTALRRNIDAGAYALMLRAQQIVDIPTWWGAYEKAIASGNDQERSVALADQAVIDAQGSGTGKDLAAIERGGPALKLFTTFYSFFNTALNVGVEKTMTRKNREASRADLAADYLLLYTVPVILVKAMKDALTPGDSGDWDWEDPLSILGHLIKENISFMTNLLFGVRELGGLVNAATGKPGGDYGGPSGLRTIGDTYKLTKELGQGVMDDGLRKAIVNLASDLARLPGAQMNRSITGAEALYEGDTTNPAALIFGYQKQH